MQQDTNTITQFVIDYFNISNFCMNTLGNSQWNRVSLFPGISSNLLPPEIRF